MGPEIMLSARCLRKDGTINEYARITLDTCIRMSKSGTGYSGKKAGNLIYSKLGAIKSFTNFPVPIKYGNCRLYQEKGIAEGELTLSQMVCKSKKYREPG